MDHKVQEMNYELDRVMMTRHQGLFREQEKGKTR